MPTLNADQLLLEKARVTLRMGGKDVGQRMPRPREGLWPAPYGELTSESAYRFLTECWWTWNEADSKIALIPKIRLVRDFAARWVDCYVRRRPMVVEKSRRLMVSWMCRGLECWAMGLARGSWLIVDQTHEASAEHLWRIHFALSELYSRRPELGLKPHEKLGSDISNDVRLIKLPNGSLIKQGHQESGSAQGKGMSGITLEELSKYGAPAGWWGQSLIVTQGSAESSGGWVCGVANPSLNDDWHEVKGGMDPRKFLEIELGVPKGGAPLRFTELESGTEYVAIHYSADEGKGPEWAERTSKGVPVREWLREMELYQNVFDGEPVFADFVEKVHAPGLLRDQSWKLRPGSTYIGGIDCGQTLWPAAVVFEVGPAPFYQVVAMREWTCLDGNEPMSVFAPRVMRDVQKLYPHVWDQIEWIGDATVAQRNGTDGRTAADEARKHGLVIKGASNALNGIHGRLSAVTWLLTDWVDADCPRIFICGKDCPMLLKGFLGAYRFRKRAAGEEGRDLREPLKDVYSHVMDSFQQASLVIRKNIQTPIRPKSPRKRW